jgi:hypothetical protein
VNLLIKPRLKSLGSRRLTTMLTLPVEAWIGNAASVVSGAWGAVTRRAKQSGYSRTAIYQHAERVVQAVANEQASGISYEELWAENERLKAENEALWHAWSETEDLSESKQRELASAGSAMGLSLTQIVVLLAIVLPSRMAPSRATVGRWVQQSARQSRGILEVLDRACQRWVLVLCLDEIFFHQVPILMGVEPNTVRHKICFLRMSRYHHGFSSPIPSRARTPASPDLNNG